MNKNQNLNDENSKYILNFKLDQFDGPLDLLIELIKEKKMDILTLNIADLTYQYLEFVNNNLTKLPIDNISEYLVMASYLTELKTKSLLTSYSNYDEIVENDLEIDRLRRQLFLYKQYKEIINEFRLRQSLRTKYISKKCDDLDEYIPDDIPEAPLKDHIPIDKIVRAWQKIVIENRNKQEIKPFVIKVNNIDIDKIEANLIDFVESNNNIENIAYEQFINMFSKNKLDIEHYCAIFMCLLVLAKNGFIKMIQNDFCGPIHISKNHEKINEAQNDEIINAIKSQEDILNLVNNELHNKTDITKNKQSKNNNEGDK